MKTLKKIDLFFSTGNGRAFVATYRQRENGSIALTGQLDVTARVLKVADQIRYFRRKDKGRRGKR